MLSDASDGKVVHYDDVDFDDDLALVAGKPFTGMIVSEHPDGSAESRRNYVEGLPEGEQQEWYPTGQLERRWIAIRGHGSSEVWSWHANGQPRTYRRNIDQKPVEVKAWDEEGKPRDPSDFD